MRGDANAGSGARAKFGRLMRVQVGWLGRPFQFTSPETVSIGRVNRPIREREDAKSFGLPHRVDGVGQILRFPESTQIFCPPSVKRGFFLGYIAIRGPSTMIPPAANQTPFRGRTTFFTAGSGPFDTFTALLLLPRLYPGQSHTHEVHHKVEFSGGVALGL